ncbi:DegV family protein [Barrientosiimonas marina]|uniref:DegV family protein n=1 Tax=Lentibacillus kimchii TaxID=1542911 RepID=A0ABW2USK6_9BACI
MPIQLMTDGGADIPERLSHELAIRTVPLYLHFGTEEYKSDALINGKTFNQTMAESDKVPQSSAASPHDYYQAFKQTDPADPIIMLSLSRGLSTTYDNAVHAKQMLLEEEPDRQIEVINTKTASCGIALLLREAGTKLEEHYSYDQLRLHLHERVEQTNTLFVLKTLENLILGGRLSRVKGTIAKTLSIKALMKSDANGAIAVSEKVRGDKKAIRRFIEQIGESMKHAEGKMLTMSHYRTEERAKSVLERIKQTYPFSDTHLAEMSPVIATHAGEGGLVISFFKD